MMILVPLSVIVGVGVIVHGIVTGSESAAAGAFVLCAGAWNSYWFLWLVAYRVDVDVADGALEWKAPLRRVTVPISNIVDNDTFFGLQRLWIEGERSLYVIGGRAWIPFLESLNAACGHDRFQPSRLTRLGARFSFGDLSRYEEE